MDFHNNVDSAEDDLIRMFKFIKDRQIALLQISVGLDEEYGQLIAILKSNTHVNVGQIYVAKTEIAPSYQEDFRKFIEDSVTSLGSHTRHFSEKLGDISDEYQRFVEVWNNMMNELRDSAIKLLGENRILDVELFKFKKQF